jgi:site-specific DNA-methyltransferase (adenine-specific)
MRLNLAIDDTMFFSPGEKNEAHLISRIKELSSDSLEGAIERGHILKTLDLAWHEYESKNVGISFQTGYRLISLVDHPRMQRTDWEKPCLWTVCYELLQVTDKLFDAMLNAGFVGYHTTRRQVRDYVRTWKRRRVSVIPVTQRIDTGVDKISIFNEDCLTGMTRIADGSVDMILADLPYGVTENVWDSVIPLAPLWDQYKRIIKRNGAIVLTAQIPFSIMLGASNLPWLRYEWVWEKEQGTNFLMAKQAPLKSHENVLVFSEGVHTYNPQMEPGKPYVKRRNPSQSTNWKDCASRDGKIVVTMNDGYRYPKTVLRFGYDNELIHPTQKPVALFEYLVRTYTNPGELVLAAMFE